MLFYIKHEIIGDYVTQIAEGVNVRYVIRFNEEYADKIHVHISMVLTAYFFDNLNLLNAFLVLLFNVPFIHLLLGLCINV